MKKVSCLPPKKKVQLTKLKTRAKIAEQNLKNLKARLEELSEKQGENVASICMGISSAV